MILQWIGAIVAVLGFVWTGVKDYKRGDLQLPNIVKSHVSHQQYPIQYCVMAYDPNTNLVWYQHEDGKWYNQAPPLRTYR